MNHPVAVPEVLSTDLPAGAFLLDVREDDEWAAGHAPGALHIRLGELGARTADLGGRLSTTAMGEAILEAFEG